jgi:hypothetical protein
LKGLLGIYGGTLEAEREAMSCGVAEAKDKP